MDRDPRAFGALAPADLRSNRQDTEELRCTLRGRLNRSRPAPKITSSCMGSMSQIWRRLQPWRQSSSLGFPARHRPFSHAAVSVGRRNRNRCLPAAEASRPITAGCLPSSRPLRFISLRRRRCCSVRRGFLIVLCYPVFAIQYAASKPYRVFTPIAEQTQRVAINSAGAVAP